MTREELENRMAVLLGGREALLRRAAAELLARETVNESELERIRAAAAAMPETA